MISWLLFYTWFQLHWKATTPTDSGFLLRAANCICTEHHLIKLISLGLHKKTKQNQKKPTTLKCIQLCSVMGTPENVANSLYFQNWMQNILCVWNIKLYTDVLPNSSSLSPLAEVIRPDYFTKYQFSFLSVNKETSLIC